MPELPDITVYVEALDQRVTDKVLVSIRIANPFLVRSVDPPLAMAHGRRVRSMERLGKRIVFRLEDDLALVLHLMIAGRLHWTDAGKPAPRRKGLAYFDFDSGTLMLTEAGSKRRASLYLVRGSAGLAAHDPGGIEILEVDIGEFSRRLTRENRTLKRVLTDPRIFSGIGNAYSDEILHRARLSPTARTRSLAPQAIADLYAAAKHVLGEWTERLRAGAAGGFPADVTAFRPEMAVHGRYRKPCPVCASPVQRVVYATNESNYCPTCQTGGKLLADRALSKLLHGDWPRTLEELEERRAGPRNGPLDQDGASSRIPRRK